MLAADPFRSIRTRPSDSAPTILPLWPTARRFLPVDLSLHYWLSLQDRLRELNSGGRTWLRLGIHAISIKL